MAIADTDRYVSRVLLDLVKLTGVFDMWVCLLRKSGVKITSKKYTSSLLARSKEDTHQHPLVTDN